MQFLLLAQMARAERITEDLKAQDQMAWARARNSIEARVSEIICHDLIHA